MRRSALLTVAVLGGLVCLIGGTVLFSALQDTARTGTNSAESAAMAPSADIQLAHATIGAGGRECGAFAEDLTSGLFTASGVSPGYQSNAEHFCIKNVGSQPVTLSVLADELTDVDFACTGDEAANGDTTCGGDQLGELSSVLKVGYLVAPCSQTGGSFPGPVLKDHATTPFALGTLAAGATGCYSTLIHYPSTTAVLAVQTAQSDRATWRFKFNAQA
jgi:hypothetical protein